VNYRKLTRRLFIALGILIGLGVSGVFGYILWFLRRECKQNHSVKNNPVPDDHFRNVIETRLNPPELSHLEVVTVDSTAAIVTWATAAKGTFEIKEIGGSGLRWTEMAPANYHAAELAGLQPDAEYSFLLVRTGGGLEERFAFRTLPDAGEILFTFATFSDNHAKPDGISWPDGRYFRRCSDIHRRLVSDLNRARPDFIINKGDLTDSYQPYRLRVYREVVRGLEAPTHCIPGNHDHLRNDDFMRDWVDFAGTEQIYRSFDYRGFHFVLLDTCWTGTQKRGYLGPQQMRWLVDDLDKNAPKRTLIFTHHPMNGEVAEERVVHDYVEFQKAIADFPNVVAVFSAHVHRNYVTASEITPHVPYVETAAVIQYPIGYNLYEVTTTGIKQVFRKLSDISLSEESWLASSLRCLTNPGDALGSVSDRNFFLKFR
jgi:hypothetical protein